MAEGEIEIGDVLWLWVEGVVFAFVVIVVEVLVCGEVWHGADEWHAVWCCAAV